MPLRGGKDQTIKFRGLKRHLLKQLRGLRLKSERGFSLIEAILSTLILSVSLAGGMLVMQNVSRHAMTGELNTTAIQLANEKMDMIMADKEFKGYDYLISENYPTETELGTTGVFTRQVSIMEVSRDNFNMPQVGSGLKKVDVIVSWGLQSGSSVTLSTLLANVD